MGFKYSNALIVSTGFGAFQTVFSRGVDFSLSLLLCCGTDQAAGPAVGALTFGRVGQSGQEGLTLLRFRS